MASFEIHPGTKKRRMLCIVVSRLSAMFHRMMLLDYQIGLDFAFQGGFRMRGQNDKLSPSTDQNSTFT